MSYIYFQLSTMWMHCVITQRPLSNIIIWIIITTTTAILLVLLLLLLLLLLLSSCRIGSGEGQEHRWGVRRSECLAAGHRVRGYGVRGYKGGERREERRLSSGPELTENSPEICLSQPSKSSRSSGRAAKSTSCRIWSKSMSSRLLWGRTTIES